jgi:hypothetical protein
MYLEDAASNYDRTETLRRVFVIDRSEGRVIYYSPNEARYVDFCQNCKKAWSETAVTWSSEYTDSDPGPSVYKSTLEGSFDWQQGRAYEAQSSSYDHTGDAETMWGKERSDFPKCTRIDVDTYDFESLP